MKRTEKSQKRTKFLLLLIVLTAILSITATYAWFSTQRDVEIVGMRLNVEVAESMQISLDGEKWTQTIQIANMRQFYGSYAGTLDSFAIYQAKPITANENEGNTNYVPTELKPVSSSGAVSAGKLQLVTADYEGTILSNITLCNEDDLTTTASIGDRQNENDSHPYLVFDMYLRNISAKTGTDKDTLKLNENSNVYINTATTDDGEQEGIGVSGTGLEYSARVGFVLYENTVSTSAEDIEGGLTVGQQVRAISSTGTNAVVAIWEPNDKNHTTYVVSNNSMGITNEEQAVTTKAVLNTAATVEDLEIDLSDASADTYLSAVNTFKPAYTLGTGTDDPVGLETITSTAGSPVYMQLVPNAISKVRVYVWLEGQDPDCVDLASTGDKLNVTIRLTKDVTSGVGGNTYE